VLRIVVLVALVLGALAPADAHAGKLRRVPNTTPEQGIFYVDGSLDGIRPDGRVVRELWVSRLRGPTAEGLQPLAAFPELRQLELEWVSGVDLTPLTTLRLRILSVRDARDLDLAPLAGLRSLEHLSVVNVRNVNVPPALALSPTLRSVDFLNDGYRLTGDPVKALVDAIDWSQLSGLQFLGLMVGGLDPAPPISVDLGFLRGLTRLKWLRIEQGIRHRGPQSSPLAPPFAGLPRSLREIRIDSPQPKRLERALKRRFRRAAVSVSPRVPYRPGTGSWTIFRHSDGSWGTYGSFCEAAEGRDGDTEHAALQAAKRRLRATHPALLERLDFDQEAEGTGVAAPRRSDLVKLLRLIGVR
jgi:hypothetical protein